MRNGLLRSAPFRLALILGATFFAALFIAGLIAFSLIRSELAQRMDRSITDSFNDIAQSYGDSDQTDLIDTVNGHARATLNDDRIYGLVGPAPAILAGNVGVVPEGLGWMTVQGTALGIRNGDEGGYRVFIGDIGENRMLVGQSFVQNTEIARLALTSIGWASLAILVLVVATGALLALRAQRRIDSIAGIMARIGQGELSARIPVGRRGDDIDLLARQVNAALDRLSHLVEGMRQVSVNIAHDLKTPLNRLAITLEAAIKAEEAGAPAAPLLEQAEEEIGQINATFDALLRIAQIEAGARRERFVEVRLGDVLDRIGDAYGEVAEERGQHLEVNHQTELPEIEGDRDLLTQLCANLIENSMRHCPQGTSIAVLARRAENRIVLTVSDNGPGIPAEERANVFQRLYRLDKSRTTSGSGLGLSLVKAVADLHAADIAIGDNAPGLWISIAFPIWVPRPLRRSPGREA